LPVISHEESINHLLNRKHVYLCSKHQATTSLILWYALSFNQLDCNVRVTCICTHKHFFQEVIVVSENITGSGFPPGAHPQVPESTLIDALKVPQMNSLPNSP